MNILVTSGPTKAYLDRVRYIANSSSGLLGARIVEALVARGLPIIHLYGQGSERPKINNTHLIESIEIIGVPDLITSLEKISKRGDVSAIIHAMAVLDYVPETKLPSKKPSDEDIWDVRFVKTPKVIRIIRELMPSVFTVGFKLESGVADTELITRGRRFLEKYALNLVVANDSDRVSSYQHEAVFLEPDGTVIKQAHTKEEIAEYLAEYIEHALNTL